MDFIELAVYGNINRDGLKCANHSVKDMEGNGKKVRVTVGLGNGVSTTHQDTFFFAVDEASWSTNGMLL